MRAPRCTATSGRRWRALTCRRGSSPTSTWTWSARYLLASRVTHLFTAVDRSTRWAEAFLLSDTTAAACADALFQGWIGRFGVPDVITSDRGPQFSSDAWSGMCKRLGICHIMTTAYHPQANGIVERMHRRLKEAMWARQ